MGEHFDFYFVIPFLVLSAIVLVYVLAGSQAAARRISLKDWAERQGFSFTSQQPSLIKRFLFSHTSYACNVIEGVWRGRRVKIFDYHYDNKEAFTQLVILLDDSLPVMPRLSIRPEGAASKWRHLWENDNAPLQSLVQGSLLVASDDEEWLHVFLSNEVSTHLGSGAAYTIVIQNREVMLTLEGALLEPMAIDAALEYLNGLILVMPKGLAAS